MPGNEEFLLAPVKAGMCSYADLKNGNLDLCDVALMNDFLAMCADNEELARQLAEEK